MKELEQSREYYIRKISEKYDTYIKSLNGSTEGQLLQNEFILDYNSKADMYDRLFQEKEAKFQQSGGRKRGQTLQEYVLLFFFVGFFIFAISLSIFASTQSGSTNIGGKVFGLMFIIIFISTGLIISYG